MVREPQLLEPEKLRMFFFLFFSSCILESPMIDLETFSQFCNVCVTAQKHQVAYWCRIESILVH